MSQQLRLIDASAASAPTAWRLDDQTRKVGREGIAAARRALQDSRPGYAAPDTQAA